MSSIIERYAEKIVGTFSCFDRVVITGMLVDIGHARAMAAALSARGVRLFDYTKFAEPLRDEVRAEAQKIADGFDVKKLHRKRERFARLFCPVVRQFKGGIHWSLMQLEYATDIVFRTREDLAPFYEGLVRTSIHAVKAENVATFLGRKLDGRFVGEIGNDFHTRIEGPRIRHHMGPAAIKMYDKHGRVLRIETTANKVNFFKHRRTVE